MSRRLRTAVGAGLLCGALVLAGCSSSDGGSGDAKDATTTTTRDRSKGFQPDPKLPADINPIPFLKGNLVALGNVKLKVTKVDDPDAKASGDGTRRATLTVEVTNGALEPLELKAKTFLVYVANGQSDTPPSDAMGKAIPSGKTVTLTLPYDLPKRSELIALVFDGNPYGDRFQSGLIAIDPNYKLPKADS